MRRILGIDDRDIDAQIALQGREMALDRFPPRASDHIAAQKDVHDPWARFRLRKLRISENSSLGCRDLQSRNSMSGLTMGLLLVISSDPDGRHGRQKPYRDWKQADKPN
jgi:hypothetical protein